MARVVNFDLDKKPLSYVHTVVSGSYDSSFHLDELALVPGGGFAFHSLPNPGAATPATQALPFTATSSTVRGTFASSGSLGTYLSLLFDDSGAGIVHTPCADVSSVESTLNRSLWRLKGKTRDGRTFDVGSNGAGSFLARASIATTEIAGTAWIFEWRGVAIPNAPDGDTVWVRIAVLAPSGGRPRLCLLGWFGREIGNSARVETFQYPVLAIQNYGPPDGEEDQFEAARRMRLLVPMNEQNTMPLQVSNMPVATLAQVGMPERTVGFPGPIWFAGFAATCCTASFDPDKVRRVVMPMVRDGDDNHVKLTFRCVQGPSDVYVMLKPGQSVPFERGFAAGAIEPGTHGTMLFPESEWGNSTGPRTVIELHAFQALTDDWWYDCAERYREAVIAERPQPRKLDNNDLSTFGKGPNLLITTMTFANKPASLPYATSTLLDLVDTYLAAHDQSDVPLTNRVIVHFQLWQNGHSNVNTCKPDFSDVIPEIRQAIQALADRDVRVSLYVINQNDFDDASWYRKAGLDVLPAATLDGIGRQATDADGKHFVQYDRRDPNFQQLVPQRLNLVVIGNMMSTASYSDAFSGGVDELGVWGGEGSPRVASGNDQRAYVKGQHATIARLRELLRTVGTNGVDPDFPVFAEGQQEGLPLDWQGGGYEMIPCHVDLADSKILELVYGAGLVPTQFTDSSPQLRNSIPPIFQCVHSRSIGVGRFSATPTTGVLQTSSLQPGGYGLTAAQWLDSLCCAWAVLRIQGICSFVFAHNSDYLRGPATIDGGGNLIVSSENATGEGLTFLAFSKLLFRSLRFDYAGQFLHDGTMLRPLILDWTGGLIATSVNPASYYPAVYGRNGSLLALEAFWFIYAQGLLPTGELAFQVPSILHSVWQAEDGTVGIVLINWTSAAAAWEGTFTPALYGFGAGSRTVTKLVLGGAPVVLGSSALASFTLRSAAVSGGTVYLGHLAARSITVLTVT